MSYASDDDIELAAGGEEKLVELADWDGDGTADPAVVARAKAAADGKIDAHLRLRMSQEDLDRLRTTPTATISDLAARLAIIWIKRARNMASPDDTDHEKSIERDLAQMKMGQQRPDDSPTAQRSAIVENTSAITKKNTRGMW